MEMPRAWTETALERRISVALLAGSLLKAIAAVCAPQAMGRWDRQPVRSAGRLANYLDLVWSKYSCSDIEESSKPAMGINEPRPPGLLRARVRKSIVRSGRDGPRQRQIPHG